MERVFIKFPAGVAHVDVAPALGFNEAHVTTHYSRSDERVVVTEASAEQQAEATERGARIYRDWQFWPADQDVVESIPEALRFWDVVGPAAPVLLNDVAVVAPAAPAPWSGLSLNDVARAIFAEEAWQLSRGDAATIVVVDSGVDGNAAEFPQSKRSNLSFTLAYSQEGPWVDRLGHGSMMAAIAAGAGAPGGKYSGIAPNAKVLSARTNYRATDLYAIYDRLISYRIGGQLVGPVVVNNSYASNICASAGQIPRDHPYAEISAKVVASGMPMIFAAGNNHADMCCGNPPDAAAPNTIWAVNSLDPMLTVGAVNWDKSNVVGGHANSSRGPGEWSVSDRKPDLVAPCYGDVLWGHSYRTLEWWGTSGATAVVSGVAALVLSVAHARGVALSPSDLAGVLRETCDPIPAAATCVGRGVVNAARAVQRING